MSSNLLPTRTRHKVIVGIDYGTTFSGKISGVSYVTTDKTSIDDVEVVTDWPGLSIAVPKTPTRIAYRRENPSISSENNKWGYQVTSKHTSYSWTKLLLDGNSPASEHDDPTLSDISSSGMLRLPSFRDASGVCEDFLAEIYRHLSQTLKRRMTSSIFDITPMECWITLPAIWSDEAKDKTLAAAQRAGFGNRVGDEVLTITEPEAAAIATLTKYSSPDAINHVNVNENIMVCDCGGGTVDITTYTITQTSPFLDFDELLIGTGAKCGSTYIDRQLHKLLSQRFGSCFDNLTDTEKGPGSQFMTMFEMYKRDFGRNDDRESVEVWPIKLGIPNSDFYDADENMVKLSYDDMKSLFDPVISDIKELVSEQVKTARVQKKAKIDRIILVGGFAESTYLNEILRQWCFQNGDIKLMCPSSPQSAIVRGAAFRGLQGIKPRIRRMRRHYGVSGALPFRDGIDPEQSAIWDNFENQKLCKIRIKWLIFKEDEILEHDHRITECLQEYFPHQFNGCGLSLFSSTSREAPEYTTDLGTKKVGEIHSTFLVGSDFGSKKFSRFNQQLGRMVYGFWFDLRITFGARSSNLLLETITDGRVISNATLIFEH